MIGKNNVNVVSIKLNAITNYIGQFYSIAIAVIITPLYLQYLGAESYGVVGFFILMQNWLNLLDMGLSTTLCRQVAYARGQNNGFDKFHHLLRSFELIFLVLTLCIVVVVYFSSDWLGSSWIKSITLNPENIAYCINIMGIIIGMRFFFTIYRSGIIGFEDQVWLNKASIVFNSLRYFGSFLIMAYISNDIRHFFEYQLALSLIETAIVGKRFYLNLPSINMLKAWFKIEWGFFFKIVPFSLSIAYTSAILLTISQFDKLLLSGFLPLQEFGYLSLITLIAGAVISLSHPVFLAFLPKLTILVAKHDFKELIAEYSNMTQLITWITFSSSLLISIYSQEILYFLTGDSTAHSWGHEILSWYVLGSGIFVLGSFQYYLQNAFGTLRLYAIGLTISIIIQVPLIYFVAIKYGALGTGQLWFFYSVIWFLLWTWVVHNKFFPDLHLKWLFKDILPIMLSVLILSFFLSQSICFDLDESRTLLSLKLSIIGIVFLFITSISVRSIRNKVFEFIKIRFRFKF